MEWYTAGVLMLVSLFALMLIGLPIALVLGLSAVGFMFSAVGAESAVYAMFQQFQGVFTGYSWIPLPMFILMGELVVISGMGNDIFETAAMWLKGLPGGLALVTDGACAVFATLSGTSVGATATMGLIAIPQMLKRGYSKRLACGVVAAAGGLAPLIPPSSIAVVYAMLVQGSVAKQLMAGAIPGIIMAAVYAGIVFFWVWRNPAAAPREPAVAWGERFRVLKKVILPVIVVFAVVGLISAGIGTVTEASAVGALALFIIALSGGKFSRKRFIDVSLATARMTCFVMFIIVGSKLFGWVLSYYTVPQHLVQILTDLQINRWIVMILIQVGYLILGCFMTPVTMMVITVPILLPVILNLGFDPVWFGTIFFINGEVATVTPPVGMHLFVLKGMVGESVPMRDIILGGLIFALGDLFVIALLMFFPALALWLPNMLFGA